jgi:N-acetylmuramoyl-L-alanine amidase
MRASRLIRTTLLYSLLAGLLNANAAIRTITSKGTVYVPLSHIAQYYGMKSSAPAKDRVRLQNKWHTLEFETDSRRCWINGILVWLNHPVRKIGWQWALQNPDFQKTIDPSVRPYAFLKNAGAKVVVLDPGHGGKDKGAVSPRKVYEKLVVMDVAKRIRNHLQARGLTVRFTRDDDRTLTLAQRTQKAKQLGADLFVSLHADSASKTAEGAGTFVLSLPNCYSTHGYGKGAPSSTAHIGNKHDIANQALAFRIQQNLIKSTGQTDRGVKRARFQVLRDAPCPAALVELAFITNPKEERMVIDPNGREKLARGVANGIAAYLYDIKRSKK